MILRSCVNELNFLPDVFGRLEVHHLVHVSSCKTVEDELLGLGVLFQQLEFLLIPFGMVLLSNDIITMFDHIPALKVLLTYVDLMHLQPPRKLAILENVRFGN